MATKAGVRQTLTSAWLPMPLSGKRGPLSSRELLDYRMARDRHHQLDPTYESGWRRPPSQVVEAVWELLAPVFKVTTDRLFPLSPPLGHRRDHPDRETGVRGRGGRRDPRGRTGDDAHDQSRLRRPGRALERPLPRDPRGGAG
jgi:hypothetical protein